MDGRLRVSVGNEANGLDGVSGMGEESEREYQRNGNWLCGMWRGRRDKQIVFSPSSPPFF